MGRWIDTTDCEVNEGDVGFLVEVQDQNNASERWSLRERPAHTNQSHEPRLTGWCGTTNNRAVFAHGLARIAKTNSNGRVKVEGVDATEELLDGLGYPELWGGE